MKSKYKIVTTARFNKDVNICINRGLNIQLLFTAIDILSQTGTLPKKYKQHKLSGKYAGKWECHIKGDWLLIWERKDNEMILLMTNTGSHADLFE